MARNDINTCRVLLCVALFVTRHELKSYTHVADARPGGMK